MTAPTRVDHRFTGLNKTRYVRGPTEKLIAPAERPVKAAPGSMNARKPDPSFPIKLTAAAAAAPNPADMAGPAKGVEFGKGRPAGGFSHEPLAPVQVVGEVLPVERGSQSVVSTVYWPGTVDDVRTHHEIPPPADRAELEDDVRAQPVDVVLRCVELKTEVLRPRGELAR